MDDKALSIGDFALYYKSLGWRSVVLPAYERQSRVAGPAHDIGVLLGRRSGDLISIDFCWQEAQELGQELLGMLPSHGSDSAPFRHRVARGKLSSDLVQFRIPANAAYLFNARSLVLLEIRGEGQEAKVPPSVDSEGERLTWNGPLDDIPVKKKGELEEIGGTIAALAVVAHAYRRCSGRREAICQALMGALVQARLHPSDAELCTERVAFLAFDEDWFLRGAGATEIRTSIESGECVPGVTELCNELGIEPMAGTLRRWLGIAAEDAAPVRERKARGGDNE